MSLRPWIFSSTFALVACGASANPEPAHPTPAPSASAPEPAKKEPPPIPISPPEVSAAPATCEAFTKVATGKPKDPVCNDAKSVLGALATAAAAEKKGDVSARDAALASVATCEKVPALLIDATRAELAPIECAESILGPAIDAHAKESLPQHQAAARALVGASRLSRLRPTKGAFDLLARAEVEPAAGEAGTKLVIAWKDAIEKLETEALVLSKGAPAEIAAIVRFEAAAAWLAFAKELRGTPLPDEIKSLKKNDPDLETRYFGKLDEVTMPVVDRARQLALAGLGAAVRDGILVKTLPSFTGILEPFRSRQGFEVRKARELDLLVPEPKDPSDAAKIAAVLPPWSVYGALERAQPASLLDGQVLFAMAGNRGIPATLRQQADIPSKTKLPAKEQKARDEARNAVVLSRVRVALSYGSRPDAEAAALGPTNDSEAQLRVAVAKALVGPTSPPPKLGTPAATAPKSGYDLSALDALAKKPGAVGHAAAYDAALLSLDAAQIFGGDAPDPITPADPKKAYQDAIVRLDAVAARKGLDPARAANAKKLADDARESIKLLDKPVPSKKTP
ncbi:MAG: hypothetical protein ACXWUG_02015 [Polyangiales bacterium]